MYIRNCSYFFLFDLFDVVLIRLFSICSYTLVTSFSIHFHAYNSLDLRVYYYYYLFSNCNCLCRYRINNLFVTLDILALQLK